MEIATVIPEWQAWLATCSAGLVALALLVRGLEAVLDLELD